MILSIRTLMVTVAFAVPATFAHAELTSTMTAYVVTKGDDGVERRKPADAAEPGDVVEYRMVHTNTFDHPVGGVAVVGPVPDGMTLVSAAEGRGAQGVIEVQGEFDPDRPGEEWSTLPATKIVVDSRGQRVRKAATVADFTAVRWRLSDPLPKAASVEHVYRTRLE